MNDEFSKMWKEAILAYFKVLTQEFLKVLQQNHNKPQPSFKPSTYKYKTVLITMPQNLV
jgi:hypothetical protein